MKTDSLYKAFPGRFYVLDENGKPTDNYKDKALFKNTYGIAFFINSATKGRGYVIYFARDEKEWDLRTVFSVGKIIENDNIISLKTRYNTFVWDATCGPTTGQTNSLLQWIKANGDTYIPGFTRHEGVKEFLDNNTVL